MEFFVGSFELLTFCLTYFGDDTCVGGFTVTIVNMFGFGIQTLQAWPNWEASNIMTTWTMTWCGGIVLGWLSCGDMDHMWMNVDTIYRQKIWFCRVNLPRISVITKMTSQILIWRSLWSFTTFMIRSCGRWPSTWISLIPSRNGSNVLGIWEESLHVDGALRAITEAAPR